jgi:hypothetical protein
MIIKLGDKHQVQAKKKGVVRLGIEAFFVAKFLISVLSIGQLDSQGHTSTFKSGICSITNTRGRKVFSAILEQGLYVLSTDRSTYVSEIKLVRTAKNVKTLKTWYQRFAHLNYQDLERILNPSYDQLTNTMDVKRVESVMDDTKRVESVTDPMDVELVADPIDVEPAQPVTEPIVKKTSDSIGKCTDWGMAPRLRKHVFTRNNKK